MFQTKIGEISKDVQSLAGRYVPVFPFLYLSEDPGLNESTSTEKGHQKQIFGIKKKLFSKDDQTAHANISALTHFCVACPN